VPLPAGPGYGAAVTSASERPLLFLDVDGPLIPFGSPSGHPQAATASAATPADRGNPLLTRLDPGAGARLLALGCDLVWATTWTDEANEVVAPRIGLPALPMVEWPQTGAEEGPRGLHWKTRPLVEWAGGRPFVWVDDEISAMDRQWVAARHPGPALLHRVDPAEGLTDADFAVLARWTAARSFLSSAAEVARLLGLGDAAGVPEDRRARYLAHAVRKPLLERAGLPEEFFAPLMAAAVHDPDPSFCRWFVEPAVYAFGRRRVLVTLLAYLRTGTDAERAGARRAWYCAHVPLRPDRSPAYAPGGSRDPALDESQDVVAEWSAATRYPDA
jgi:hypothetical protein